MCYLAASLLSYAALPIRVAYDIFTRPAFARLSSSRLSFYTYHAMIRFSRYFSFSFTSLFSSFTDNTYSVAFFPVSLSLSIFPDFSIFHHFKYGKVIDSLRAVFYFDFKYLMTRLHFAFPHILIALSLFSCFRCRILCYY